ncbi:MAG TPA: hypothetical protein GX391_05760 [Firmicutes bacterium]|nr:hypothetical protein [Bacillota bacterium]HOQ24349.1 DUF5668 domain-containing protein [Bacillota bacterium]HPT67681.1 DUF5668 domain-containing protein [Bacillota bacterium]
MRRPSNGFGLVLVLVGTLLLMNNLGYIRLHWGQVWPAFPLVFGLSLFLQFLHDWDRGILVPATLFSGAGIFFYYLVNSPTGFNWGALAEWWPIFPLLLGVGFILGYLADPRDTGFLIPAAIFVLFGGLSLAGKVDGFRFYAKYWPLLLILFGLVMILTNIFLGKRGKG